MCIAVQSASGAAPGGFVATEFQEYMRVRVLPAIRQFARDNFREREHPPWMSWSSYRRLCAAVDRVPSAMDPMFLLSLDADSRHSMKHFWPAIDRPDVPARSLPPPPDRRLLPEGSQGYIHIHPEHNYVPSAPRVPDSVQFPIESMFSGVKRAFRAFVRDPEACTAGEMWLGIQAAFQDSATAESIKRRFEHAEKNMRVFSGVEGQTVQIEGVQYHCTHGNWLPSVLRA